LIPGAIALWILASVGAAHGLIGGVTWPDTTFDWAIFLVGSFVIGYLAHPPAHVLNWLYDRTYRTWRRREGDLLLDYARTEAGPELGPKDSVYAWAKSEVSAESAALAAKIARVAGISKMFRTLAFVALVGCVFCLFTAAWIFAAILAALFLLSFLVFGQLRFEATKEVYQGLRRLRQRSLSAVGRSLPC
jgi:hypothetical protein